MNEVNNFYFTRARFYNNEYRRFNSLDPIGLQGGDTNLYRYVGNNPQSFIDPSGLFLERPNLSQYKSTVSKGLMLAGGLIGMIPTPATRIAGLSLGALGAISSDDPGKALGDLVTDMGLVL